MTSLHSFQTICEYSLLLLENTLRSPNSRTPTTPPREAATGRSSSNLSRTLKTMARYSIVRMEKVRRNIRPVVEATDFTVQFGLYASSRREDDAGAVRI